jgi:hypothetical protein
MYLLKSSNILGTICNEGHFYFKGFLVNLLSIFCSKFIGDFQGYFHFCYRCSLIPVQMNQDKSLVEDVMGRYQMRLQAQYRHFSRKKKEVNKI